MVLREDTETPIAVRIYSASLDTFRAVGEAAIACGVEPSELLDIWNNDLPEQAKTLCAIADQLGNVSGIENVGEVQSALRSVAGEIAGRGTMAKVSAMFTRDRFFQLVQNVDAIALAICSMTDLQPEQFKRSASNPRPIDFRDMAQLAPYLIAAWTGGEIQGNDTATLEDESPKLSPAGTGS